MPPHISTTAKASRAGEGPLSEAGGRVQRALVRVSICFELILQQLLNPPPGASASA